MMGFQLSLILLAFAFRMENFSTGFTYGLRKLQKPLKSIVIFGLCYGIEAFMLGVALSLDAFGVGIGGAG